ncbi:hypothetical protein FOZ63_010862, partial [Perkinsus olseni]
GLPLRHRHRSLSSPRTGSSQVSRRCLRAPRLGPSSPKHHLAGHTRSSIADQWTRPNFRIGQLPAARPLYPPRHHSWFGTPRCRPLPEAPVSKPRERSPRRPCGSLSLSPSVSERCVSWNVPPLLWRTARRRTSGRASTLP